MKRIPKSRNYVFTISFADAQVTQLVPEFWPSWMTYVCWQLEIGADTNVMHYQGYLECRGQQLFTRIKNEVDGFDRAHLEVRQGSAAQAISYATKEDTRVDGPWFHGEAKGQGEKKDFNFKF